MPEVINGAIIRRKPRIVGYQKVFRKFFRSANQYIFPTIRYGTIPLLLFVSIQFTEPNPTLFEMLNPFF